MCDHFFPRFCTEFKRLNPGQCTTGMRRLPSMVELIEKIPNQDVGGSYFELCHIVGEHPGSPRALRELLDRIADKDFVNTREAATRYTVLHYAADSGSPEMVQALLQCGADVAARAPNGSTALHIASFAGNTEIVGILLEHGAPVDALDNDRNTALHGAVERGHLYSVEKLLAREARVDVPNMCGVRPTHLAVGNDFLAIFIALIQAGADIRLIVKRLER